MSTTLRLAVDMNYDNGEITHQTGTVSITISGDDYRKITQNIGTSAELLSFGDCTPGYILVVNDDSTNYIELATDNMMANIFAKITAGGMALFPNAASGTPYARANTSACDITLVAIDL